MLLKYIDYINENRIGIGQDYRYIIKDNLSLPQIIHRVIQHINRGTWIINNETHDLLKTLHNNLQRIQSININPKHHFSLNKISHANDTSEFTFKNNGLIFKKDSDRTAISVFGLRTHDLVFGLMGDRFITGIITHPLKQHSLNGIMYQSIYSSNKNVVYLDIVDNKWMNKIYTKKDYTNAVSRLPTIKNLTLQLVYDLLFEYNTIINEIYNILLGVPQIITNILR